MKKHVPYEKLSKKARREMDAKKRVTWGGMSPVTRAPERTDIYNRNKEKRRWMKGPDGDIHPAAVLFDGKRGGRGSKLPRQVCLPNFQFDKHSRIATKVVKDNFASYHPLPPIFTAPYKMSR